MCWCVYVLFVCLLAFAFRCWFVNVRVSVICVVVCVFVDLFLYLIIRLFVKLFVTLFVDLFDRLFVQLFVKCCICLLLLLVADSLIGSCLLFLRYVWISLFVHVVFCLFGICLIMCWCIRVFVYLFNQVFVHWFPRSRVDALINSCVYLYVYL